MGPNLGSLVVGHARADSVLDSGYLGQLCSVASLTPKSFAIRKSGASFFADDRDHVAPELLGIGLAHRSHPYTEDQIGPQRLGVTPTFRSPSPFWHKKRWDTESPRKSNRPAPVLDRSAPSMQQGQDYSHAKMKAMSTREDQIEPTGYGELLEQIKTQVRDARVQAARKVNTELIVLYWQIGTAIRQRQAREGWGTKVISRLADDLRTEFPQMRGLSQRNLVYMRSFAAEFPEPIAQQPVAQLPWGHVTVLLDRLSDTAVRTWYAEQATHHGGHGPP